MTIAAIEPTALIVGLSAIVVGATVLALPGVYDAATNFRRALFSRTGLEPRARPTGGRPQKLFAASFVVVGALCILWGLRIL
jgi:hypothetical protein